MFLGGVITEYASWPCVFYINVPIAVIALAAIPSLMPTGAMNGRGSVDLLGAIPVTAGLASAVYAIVSAPENGWTSTRVIGFGIAAIALLGSFIVVERIRREPLVRLSTFRTPNLGAANLAQTLLSPAWSPMCGST